jgi:hypothetical protein
MDERSERFIAKVGEYFETLDVREPRLSPSLTSSHSLLPYATPYQLID